MDDPAPRDNFIEAMMPQNLEEYMQQLPRGIRMRTNIYRDNCSALYVLNDVILGKSYQQANASVNVQNIDHVDIVRSPGESVKYGLRGVRTVVKIYTKTYVEMEQQRKERLRESRRSK